MRSDAIRLPLPALVLLLGCFQSHQAAVEDPDASREESDGSVEAGFPMDAGKPGDQPVYVYDDNCVVLNEGELIYAGQYDAFCGNAYRILLLPNRSEMFRGEAAGPRPGRVIVNLEEARISIKTRAGDEVVKDFSTPISGSMEPASTDPSGGEVAVEVITEPGADQVAEYADRKLFISIELIGQRMPGGEDVTSYPCRFPIEVCSQCLTFFAEGKGSDDCAFGDEARSEFERRHPGAQLTGRGYDGSYCVCAKGSTKTCDECDIE
jgi:hypothetical protein